MSLESISRSLADAVDALTFDEPTHTVYNPLRYAYAPHVTYLTRFGEGSKEALLLGMNPGPFGMAQTGVPFGDIEMVRDWMEIEAPVERPSNEHPKRPIQGFACPRSEVSGTRLWGWARDRFKTPDAFFARFFVWNYCPLCFMEEGGKNRTPDKLPKEEQSSLYAACDDALRAVVEALQPEIVIGVGKFAESRARAALPAEQRVATILHPSPASPIANRGWAPQIEAQLAALSIPLAA